MAARIFLAIGPASGMFTTMRTRITSLVVLATAVFTAGCGAGLPNRPAVLTPLTQAQAPRENYVAGVANFGFVSDDLWRGARPSAAGYESLAAMGVKTIVDLQEADNHRLVPTGVTYVPVRTSKWHIGATDVDAVLGAIERSPKPVFVHCEYGRDRTGLAVAAYRMRHGFTREEAVRELDNFHVHFWVREAIVRRLRAIEARNTRSTAGPSTR